jgi:hypothetical protein
MADSTWSQQEIDASVEAYVQMLQDEISFGLSDFKVTAFGGQRSDANG